MQNMINHGANKISCIIGKIAKLGLAPKRKIASKIKQQITKTDKNLTVIAPNPTKNLLFDTSHKRLLYNMSTGNDI